MWVAAFWTARDSEGFSARIQPARSGGRSGPQISPEALHFEAGLVVPPALGGGAGEVGGGGGGVRGLLRRLRLGGGGT